jgi:hypothetical protein
MLPAHDPSPVSHDPLTRKVPRENLREPSRRTVKNTAKNSMHRAVQKSLLGLAACFSLCWTPMLAMAQEFSLKKVDDGYEVHVDGKLFTRYLVQSGAKPILWPLIAPDGQEITRAWPMREETDEKKDHIHQRSFWFTHGDVNGVSFWDESRGHGTIAHREFAEAEANEGSAVLVTHNDWLAPDGTAICRDVRTLTFGADDRWRWIDFDVTVHALDQPVVFGDTKEGSFGVRLADTMRAELNNGSRIVNSEQLTDGAAWGKRAAWVDCSGPVGDSRLGVAILNHPSSFRFPTYWHVRTYGLFAANPFGVRDFLNDRNADGSAKLAPGESFTLNYRVILHAGETDLADIAEAFTAYSKEEKAGEE